MSKVDFYILADAGEAARYLFACRLAEKAYRLKNTVHIRTSDNGLATRLDELLWTFRDGSFVPHEISREGAAREAPVSIGAGDMSGGCDLLINLADAVPRDISAFARIAEIVSSDEDSKQRSRKRFSEYRDQGHTLDTHNI
ncbi:MAG: DNA polymerase III subunit chi [Woeseiaceae bacterium]